MDYSKWDTLAEETEKEEKLEKLRRREENRAWYMKDQVEKKVFFCPTDVDNNSGVMHRERSATYDGVLSSTSSLH